MVKDVVCTFCGNACDDIEFEEEYGVNLCPLGEAKFSKKDRIKAPMIDGKEVTYEEAIEKAAEILKEAKRPLLYGWSSTVNEAIRLGVIIAEKVGGIYDQCSSVCHAPTTLAMIEQGIVGGTLGQAKNRADIVVFWGCNPVEAHPRHPTRYSVMAKGFLTKGRLDRKVIVVDVRKTPTAYLATDFYVVKPNSDFAIFTALRSAINGNENAIPDEVGGLKRDEIINLAEKLEKAKYGVIFFGLGITHTRGHERNVEAVIKLVQDLNRKTRYILQPMRGHFNVVGSGEVPAWEVGFEYAIDFSRKYARFSPGEFTAVEALIRGDCDAAMIVASDPVAHFPKKAVDRLKEIPVIQIDPHPNLTTKVANVVIPTAIVGIEAEGTIYRMDGIPLRVKKIRDSKYMSDIEVMEKLLEKI